MSAKAMMVRLEGYYMRAAFYFPDTKVLRDANDEDVAAFLVDVCDSPIESRLLAALCREAPRQGAAFVEVGHDSRGHDLALCFEEEGCGWTLHIITQAECVRGVRVDVLLECSGLEAEKGRWLAIECDGHDYHERTKEQAARDRSRDRRLMAEEIDVIRFTGSEIHRDPDACAREAFDVFLRVSCRERRAIRDHQAFQRAHGLSG